MKVMLLRPPARLPVLLPVLFTATWLGGCNVFEQPAQMRGVHLDSAQMQQLVPGTTTRADVTSLIGSPTAHATFDDNTWIYIGEKTRPRIGQVLGEETQNVVVLTFDQNGTLQSVKNLNRKDAKPVQFANRATPSPGSSASILQQLFGNIGRYSPGGLGTGSSSGPGGGPP